MPKPRIGVRIAVAVNSVERRSEFGPGEVDANEQRGRVDKEATVKDVHSLQSIPSKARTERLSVPKPLWNSICASCAADTSMICDAPCARRPAATSARGVGSAIQELIGQDGIIAIDGREQVGCGKGLPIHRGHIRRRNHGHRKV